MILDANSDDIENRGRFQVCIVGSGPAGMTIGLELSRAGYQVVVLEGGGLEYDDASQNMYEGTSVGRSLPLGLRDSRMRFLGGSSNCWAGGCGTLDPIDLESRPWVLHSGWPIERKDIDPYYARAEKYLDIQDFFFEKNDLLQNANEQLSFDAAKLDVKYLLFNETGRMTFGYHYRKEIDESKTLTIITHCNVAKFMEDSVSDRVDNVLFRNTNGKIFTLKADLFVLACGGIENPRVLLNSRDKNAGGVGNGKDLVGRFFMDHVISTIATVMPLAASEKLDFLTWGESNTVPLPFSPYIAYLTLGPDIQQKERCLNSGLFLSTQEAPFSPGLRAAIFLKNALRDGNFDRIRAEYFTDILSNLGEVTAGFYEWIRNRRLPKSRIAVKFQAEQAPNPNSRVTLAEKKDIFGMNMAQLDWRFSEIDRTSLNVPLRVLSQEFGRLGLARVKLDNWVAENATEYPETLDFRGGFHHTGTTRMGSTPSTGVVDRDCRVFEVRNLFVAGSSVFPTNGWVNPTFTIVALAIRVSDTLAKELK